MTDTVTRFFERLFYGSRESPQQPGAYTSHLARIVQEAGDEWSRAVSEARGGPRVLIATNVAGFQHASLLEGTLGAALTLRGAEVHYLLCDAMLPACLKVEPHSVPDSAVIIERKIKDVLCEACQAVGRSWIEPLGLEIHRFSELLHSDVRASVREQAQTLPLDHLDRLQVDGLALGEHALAGALRYYARGTLPNDAAAESVLRRFLEASILSARAVAALLDALQFDVAVFHHGIYVPQGPTGAVCRGRGLRVVNWNPSYRRNTFIFSEGDTYHHTLIDEPVESWQNMCWGPEQEAQIMSYLASRQSGARDWIWFHERPDNDITRLVAETGVDLAKPMIGMLTNVMWDAQLHYPANAFPNMLEWALQTIRWFTTRPDLQLVIRVHPAEIRGTVPSREPIIRELQRAFGELPKNVFVIAPESDMSTYAAMERCDAVIIYGTKTGVELTSLGIPVIVAGEAWIRNKGLTFDARSRDEYFALLERLPLQQRMAPEVIARARRYAYHFFFRRMTPLPFIVPEDKKIYRLEVAQLNELKAGHWPGLDVVCDGILAGSPFVFEAERLGLHDEAAK